MNQPSVNSRSINAASGESVHAPIGGVRRVACGGWRRRVAPSRGNALRKETHEKENQIEMVAAPEGKTERKTERKEERKKERKKNNNKKKK